VEIVKEDSAAHLLRAMRYISFESPPLRGF
jgi:hypothetical protein